MVRTDVHRQLHGPIPRAGTRRCVSGGTVREEDSVRPVRGQRFVVPGGAVGDCADVRPHRRHRRHVHHGVSFRGGGAVEATPPQREDQHPARRDAHAPEGTGVLDWGQHVDQRGKVRASGQGVDAVHDRRRHGPADRAGSVVDEPRELYPRRVVVALPNLDPVPCSRHPPHAGVPGGAGPVVHGIGCPGHLPGRLDDAGPARDPSREVRADLTIHGPVQHRALDTVHDRVGAERPDRPASERPRLHHITSVTWYWTDDKTVPGHAVDWERDRSCTTAAGHPSPAAHDTGPGVHVICGRVINTTL